MIVKLERVIFIIFSIICMFCVQFLFSACSSPNLNLEGEVIELHSSNLTSLEPITTFYCQGKINKKIQNSNNFLVEISFGTTDIERGPVFYGDVNKLYIEIRADNRNGINHIVKRIRGKDFFVDDYLCYQTEKGMRYNHTEVIELPISLLSDDNGGIVVYVACYNSENISGLMVAGDSFDFYYSKIDQIVYFREIV